MIVKGWFSVLIFHYYALTPDAFSRKSSSRILFRISVLRALSNPYYTSRAQHALLLMRGKREFCQTYRRHTSAIRASWTLPSISELSDSVSSSVFVLWRNVVTSHPLLSNIFHIKLGRTVAGRRFRVVRATIRRGRNKFYISMIPRTLI